MHQRKSKKILIYFFLLILVGSINNNSINNLKLEKVKKINIFGLDENDQKILIYSLKNLDLKNIFLINKKSIQNVIENKDKIISMFDQRFFRMWEFYLLASKYSFVNMGNVVFQIQIAKNINNLPLTRNYIYN